MDLMEILVIVLGASTGFLFLVVLIMGGIIGRARARRKAGKMKIKDGNRSVNALVLSTNETYYVAENGKVKPGQYTVLPADNSSDGVTIKVNTTTKQYPNHATLVVVAGDTVNPRSGNVVLY